MSIKVAMTKAALLDAIREYPDDIRIGSEVPGVGESGQPSMGVAIYARRQRHYAAPPYGEKGRLSPLPFLTAIDGDLDAPKPTLTPQAASWGPLSPDLEWAGEAYYVLTIVGGG